MSTTHSRGYGIQGIRLKHFEQVLTKILPTIQPEYVRLPSIPPPSQKSQTKKKKKTTNDGTSSSSSSSSEPLSSSSSPSSSSSSSLWPFNELPDGARVCGKNPGQLSHPHRALRKEQQLQSMFRCILRLIPPPTTAPPQTSKSHTDENDEDENVEDDKRYENDRNKEEEEEEEEMDTVIADQEFTIVDFGGGSGHLAIPLALLLPHCQVIVVDLNSKSLDLMHQKTELVIQQILLDSSNDEPPSSSTIQSTRSYYVDDSRFRCCGRKGILENLISFEGPVEDYTESFDMALALHLCGQATDVAIRKAIAVGASSMVMAPCCVGKLSRQVLNPDIFHATGQNLPTVSYPQSFAFCQLIHDSNDWDALAKAADYSNEQESRTPLNATRRTAKAILETDRRLFLEHYGYHTALMKMDPWEATPKNDILVAWDPQKVMIPVDDDNNNDSLLFTVSDSDSQADLQIVRTQLLSDPTSSESIQCSVGEQGSIICNSDWTQEEQREIHDQIFEFLERTERLEDKMDQVFIFPTRMGGRKRKLIHYVANQFDLAHWSIGEKDSQKTVAIARRGQNKQQGKIQQQQQE